ncbi:hypothetical protein LQW54_004190 [Pestalotiopsis sp. IQ-011]
MSPHEVVTAWAAGLGTWRLEAMLGGPRITVDAISMQTEVADLVYLNEHLTWGVAWCIDGIPNNAAAFWAA